MHLRYVTLFSRTTNNDKYNFRTKSNWIRDMGFFPIRVNDISLDMCGIYIKNDIDSLLRPLSLPRINPKYCNWFVSSICTNIFACRRRRRSAQISFLSSIIIYRTLSSLLNDSNLAFRSLPSLAISFIYYNFFLLFLLCFKNNNNTEVETSYARDSYGSVLYFFFQW